MTTPARQKRGFIDWTLIAAAAFAVVAVAGGVCAYVLFEKRAAESRTDVETPRPPAIRAAYYESHPGGTDGE